MSGCDNSEDGKIFFEKVNAIMLKAGFSLRKWVSNDNSLREFIKTKETNLESVSDSVTYLEEVINTKDCTKRVLGLEWDIYTDEFVLRFDDFLQKSIGVKWTKRKILSISASVYDPLGFVSPITAKLKTIFQLLCKDKLGWDENLPSEIESVWIKLLDSLRVNTVFRVSRFCFGKLENITLVEVHGFSDSSIEAYCAVVYLRLVTSLGVRVCFLASKTKVAPLKSLTIPRLELLGCLLLSTLISEIQLCMSNRIVVDKVYCWSDSQVSLCWVKGKEKSWKPWVENRVVKIRKVVSADKWYFVKGEDNPADIPTRLTVDFDSSFWNCWINGPEFLRSTDLEFFYNSFITNDNLIASRDKECRNCFVENTDSNTIDCDILTNLTVNDMDTSVLLYQVIDINRYGTLSRLIRVIICLSFRQ